MSQQRSADDDSIQSGADKEDASGLQGAPQSPAPAYIRQRSEKAWRNESQYIQKQDEPKDVGSQPGIGNLTSPPTGARRESIKPTGWLDDIISGVANTLHWFEQQNYAHQRHESAKERSKLLALEKPTTVEEDLRRARSLSSAAILWLPSDANNIEIWKEFEKDKNSVFFSRLLDRLPEIEDYRNPASRFLVVGQVNALMKVVASDPKFREMAFAGSAAALGDCPDGVAYGFRQLKEMLMLHEAREMDSITKLFDYGVEKFRLDVMTQMALLKATAERNDGELLGVMQGYETELGPELHMATTSHAAYFGDRFTLDESEKVVALQVVHNLEEGNVKGAVESLARLGRDADEMRTFDGKPSLFEGVKKSLRSLADYLVEDCAPWRESLRATFPAKFEEEEKKIAEWKKLLDERETNLFSSMPKKPAQNAEETERVSYERECNCWKEQYDQWSEEAAQQQAAAKNATTKVVREMTGQYMGIRALIEEYASKHGVKQSEYAWEPLGLKKRNGCTYDIVGAANGKTCLKIVGGGKMKFVAIDTQALREALGPTVKFEQVSRLSLAWSGGRLNAKEAGVSIAKPPAAKLPGR